jgi:hypothetical protein
LRATLPITLVMGTHLAGDGQCPYEQIKERYVFDKKAHVWPKKCSKDFFTAGEISLQ